jgi:hypothetical protein
MLGIDTSEFNKWWNSSNPSLNIQPNSEQITLICYDKNYLSIFGLKINVKSHVYQEANSYDVQKGMILI